MEVLAHCTPRTACTFCIAAWLQEPEPIQIDVEGVEQLRAHIDKPTASRMYINRYDWLRTRSDPSVRRHMSPGHVLSPYIPTQLDGVHRFHGPAFCGKFSRGDGNVFCAASQGELTAHRLSVSDIALSVVAVQW